jgi:hypothetical protein
MRARQEFQRAIPLVVMMSAFAATAALWAQNRNPNPKFHAEIERLSAWTAKNRAEKHLTVDDVLTLNPFANSRVKIQKVAPGTSFAVTIPGDYPAGSVILSERDLVTLSDATMSAKSYAAQMTIAADAFPGFSRLFVITPISYHADFEPRFLPVAFIDAVYRVDLTSPDGIVVKIAPRERTLTLDQNQINAEAKYQAEFFKSGETKPFETLNGKQTFRNSDEDMAHFDITFFDAAGSPQAEIDEIGNKMGDPKITAAERDALMQRLLALQQKMIEEMTKGLTTDPAGLNKKQEDFGCGLLQLYRGSSAGAVEGTINCGENFHGGHLKVTGTMTLVK